MTLYNKWINEGLDTDSDLAWDSDSDRVLPQAPCHQYKLDSDSDGNGDGDSDRSL